MYDKKETGIDKLYKKKNKSKRGKIPTMYSSFLSRKVTCSRCKTSQSINATKNNYLCQHCGEKQSNEPIYGILVCSSCQIKVLYMKEIVKTVRCTNCSHTNSTSMTLRCD